VAKLQYPYTAHNPGPDVRPTCDPLELLTLGWIANSWACSERHVFNLVQSGQLPCVRIGTARGIRVRRRDLDDYLERHSGYRVDPKHSAAMKRVWRERMERATERATKRAAKPRAS
jgi:excisionase family DNA binding protein